MAVKVGDGSLYWDARIGTTQLNNDAGRIEDIMNRVTGRVAEQGHVLEDVFKNAAAAAAGFFSLQAGAGLVKQIIDVRSEFQQLEASYRTILGNKEKADALMAQTVKFASETPFNLSDVAESTKLLLAYGVGADEVNKSLKSIGDIAAVINQPINELAMVYGQIRTQGRLYAEDLNQLTGRGVPIIAELAKQFGIAEEKVKDLVASGRVGFPEIEKAFESLTTGSGKFAGAMEAQSKTIQGQLSNLEDAFDQMLNKIGEQNEGLINTSISALQSLVANYQTVLTILEELTIAYGAYKAAQLAIIATTRLQAMEMGLLRAAMTLQLNATTLFNSAQVQSAAATAGVTIALTTLIYTVRAIIAEYEHLHMAESQIADIRAKAATQLVDEKQKIADQIGVIKDHTSSQQDRATALKRIIDLNPDLLKGLNAQNVTTQQGTEIINKYISSLNDKLLAEAAYAQKLENIKRANDVRSRGYDAMSGTEMTGAILNDVFSPNVFKSGHKERVVEEYAKGFENANKEIDRQFAAQLKARAKSGGANDNTGPVMANVKNEAWYKEQIENLKKLREPLAVASAGYKDYTAKIKALETELANLQGLQTTEQKQAESAAQRALNQRKELYSEFGKLHQEYLENQKTQDQREIEQAAFKYDELLRKVDEYNTKNKVKINPAKLNLDAKGNIVDKAVKGGTTLDVNAEKRRAIDDIIAKQSVGTYKNELDAKKQLFDQYLQYQTEYGVKAADGRFKDELKGYTSYINLLQGELDKLEGDTSAAANAKRDELSARLPQAKLDASKAAFDTYVKDIKKVLTATEDFTIAYNRLMEQFQKDKTALDKELAFGRINSEDYNKRLAQLQANLDAENQATQESVVKRAAAYRFLFEDMAHMSTMALKERMAQARKQIEIDKTALDPRVYQVLFNALTNGSEVLTSRLTDKLQELAQTFALLSQSLAPFNAGLSSALNTISMMVSATYQVYSNIDKLKSGIENFSAKSQNEGGGLKGTLSAIAGVAGPAGAIISGVTSVVGSVVGFFKAAKESARQAEAEIKRYQDSLITGEITLNQTLRERLRSQQDIANLTSDELKARQEMLKLQKNQAQADFDRLLGQIRGSGQQITGEHKEKYGGILGVGKKTKVVQDLAGLGDADYAQLEALYVRGALTDSTKTWFEALQKTKNELDAIGESAEQAAVQLNRIATGTTAGDIAKAIIEGFKAGKKTAADFADTFQELMQNALLSSFETNYLKGKIDEFYKQFAAAANSDTGLTKDKIDELQKTYAGIINDAADELEAIRNISGIKGGATGSKNSLSGSIQQSITEVTAQQWEGILRGVQANTFDQLNATYQMIADQWQRHNANMAYWQKNLDAVLKIEMNTRRTADASDRYLPQIEKNTGSGSAGIAAFLRAKGIS